MKPITPSEAISNWNGKAVAQLQPIHDQYSRKPKYVDALLRALHHVGNEQVAAACLLKIYLTEGSKLTEKQTARLWSIWEELEDWKPRLIILQSVQYLLISNKAKIDLATYFKKAARDENKMVRAWAINSFFVLAQQHVEFESESEKLIHQGSQDEAPSVRARMRKIRKEQKKQK